ncbi:hypothetical protein MMC31_005634 [Peltigera leucophlebia]|nr:hypothetical protein [Peltigera leucophlebia]
MRLPLSSFSKNGHSATKEPIALPATPQQRRRQLQTDQVAQKISIEQYLRKTDPYRCSSANPGFPVPLKLDVLGYGLAHKLHEDRGLRMSILSCLAECHIAQLDVGFYNVSKPFYPNGGNVQVPTLIIDVDVGDDVSTAGWLPASQFLLNLLSKCGYPGVCVEIRDSRRYFQPSLFPLSPEDPAVHSYEAVRKDLIEIIRKRLQNTWSMMSIFKIGRDSAQAVTAIVVMVQPLANQDWWAIKKQMGKITQLEVEFAVGSCRPLTPLSAPSDQPGRDVSASLTRWPKLGCSIGVAGEQGGGTLGGFVTLSCGSMKHRGILTNAHVVEPPSSVKSYTRTQADREGTRYQDPATELTKTNVQYFAQKDIEATISSVQAKMSSDQEEIRKITESAEMRTMLGYEPKPTVTENINKLILRRERLGFLLPILGDMPFQIGRVLISSGKAVSAAKNALDWAFVEVNEAGNDFFDNPDRNLLPLASSISASNHAESYQKDTENYTDREKDTGPKNYSAREGENQIKGFSEIKKGQWYFKVGRTTDVTTGICHGTEAYCHMVSVTHRTRYGETNMRPTRVPSDYTTELVILNSKSGKAIYQQEDFCKAGDSGSWLIDIEQKVAGLLFGCLNGVCGPTDNNDNQRTYVNAGLVTSMTEVQKSIAAWTTPRDSNGAPTGSPGVLSLPPNPPSC